MEHIVLAHSESTESTLSDLVAALPEMYQPIYRHPELTSEASRSCEDRLKHLERVWHALSKALGRPARVLDLGCAQGYIAFRMAELGASVIGVDHFAENIAVCHALATEYPQLRVQFAAAPIETLFDYLDLSQIDLVLGLSVFHHMSKMHGFSEVAQWIATLGARVPACVFELALADEPVHWADAQPQDERAYLEGFACTHELARIPTHLSDVRRPLVYASNLFTYLGGHVDLFTSATTTSHANANPTCNGTRRYFFNDRTVSKIFSLRDAFPILNRSEIINEAAFLEGPPRGFTPVPRLTSYGCTQSEAWLVRERLSGELLYDRIRAHTPFDTRSVVRDILTQLVVLEAHGLYHNDVRTWNVLILDDERATLIDYGSISPYDQSFSWPTDLFSSFWVFLYCVTTGSQWSGATLAPPFASAHHLPGLYQAWVRAFLALPIERRNFAQLLETFDALPQAADEATISDPNELWQKHIETYLSELGAKIDEMSAKIDLMVEHHAS